MGCGCADCGFGGGGLPCRSVWWSWKPSIRVSILVYRADRPAGRVPAGCVYGWRTPDRARTRTRSRSLTTGEEPNQANPIVADSAPRLRLVHRAIEGDKIIECRRVVTLIGSRPGCKVNLQHRSVAGVHAAIVNDGSRVLAVDLVTKTGTFLNSLKMEHERLTDGDLLNISPWEFRVDIKEPTHAGEDDVHPLSLDPSPHVVALEHKVTGRVLRPNRDLCVVGRRAGCDIILSDNSVSRVHALLLDYFGHPAVFDLLSANHVLVNDEPVQFHVLQNEDTVSIGDSAFRVRLLGSAVAERATNNKPTTPPKPPAVPPSDDHPPDLIDIQRTESTQRWRIADSLEKTARKR